MSFITIFVLWTWGLTPIWVNVVSTVLYGIKILCDIVIAIMKQMEV
jgi:hypothetical protein